MSEPSSAEIIIVKYEDQYAEVFDRLSRAWLESYDLYEAADEKHLASPKENIIDKGGEIFFALLKGEVIGTCAVIPYRENTAELVKLTVNDKAQGKGIGRRLTQTAIDWARHQNYQKIVLVSSTKLAQALALYEKLGFSYLPLPDDISYQTADVYMELDLD